MDLVAESTTTAPARDKPGRSQRSPQPLHVHYAKGPSDAAILAALALLVELAGKYGPEPEARDA